MDETNPKLKAVFMEIVDNQIRENNPPETKTTYNRLKDSGFSDEDAKQYIGQAVAFEMFYVLKHQEPFNGERYTRNLSKLPNEPSL